MDFLGNVNVFHGRLEAGRLRSGDLVLPAAGDDGLAAGSATGYARPHDIDLRRAHGNPAAVAAVVEGLQVVGPAVRVALRRRDTGEPLAAELSGAAFRALGLQIGETVFAAPRQLTTLPRRGDRAGGRRVRLVSLTPVGRSDLTACRGGAAPDTVSGRSRRRRVDQGGGAWTIPGDSPTTTAELRSVLAAIGATPAAAAERLAGLDEDALSRTPPAGRSCLTLLEALVAAGADLGRAAHDVLGHVPNAGDARPAAPPTGDGLQAQLRFLREHIVSTDQPAGSRRSGGGPTPPAGRWWPTPCTGRDRPGAAGRAWSTGRRGPGRRGVAMTATDKSSRLELAADQSRANASWTTSSAASPADCSLGRAMIAVRRRSSAS